MIVNSESPVLQTPLFNEVMRIVSSVEGWLSDREIVFLYNAARACSPGGVILEIGSWKGKSTICLAKGSYAGGKALVYAVDPHVGTLEQNHWLGGGSSLDDFKRNIEAARIANLVIPVVKRSQDLASEWNKPISFLWIDGDHSYESAKRDFDLFSPWV
ncbi:MAG TPA: class I SAM-dependent methyltransferase, partial [Nitrospiraceae bacterium]|nr:class I SAM-dependent methyltransferase [Nitrospiraceae bacterium]